MLLSTLHAKVAIEVPGAPLFAVTGAVRDAAADFLRRSRSWREKFGPKPFLDWQSVYKIELPMDLVLVEPTEVKIDGARLRSENFWAVGIDEIEVAEGFYGSEISGEVAVTVTNTAVEVPDRIGLEFGDFFVLGALSRLMRIPNAEWSAPQHGLLYYAQFEEGIERAATRVANGFKQDRTRRVRYGGY